MYVRGMADKLADSDTVAELLRIFRSLGRKDEGGRTIAERLLGTDVQSCFKMLACPGV